MTMTRNISSSLTLGASLAALLAATPAWGDIKVPDRFELDGWARPLRPPGNDIPIHKKKVPYAHTVQEDSIEDLDPPEAPDARAALPPINEWIIDSDPWRRTVDWLDWTNPDFMLDLHFPDPLPFSPDLGTFPGALVFIDEQESPDDDSIPRDLSGVVFAPIGEDHLLMPGGSAGEWPHITSPVPAPGALALLTLGLGSMLAGRRRR